MKSAFRITSVGSIILLVFLLATDPQRLPSVLLIVPFILLFIIIACGVALIPGLRGLPSSRMVKVGGTVAAVPVLLLVLQSLGQLTVRDVLAVVVLFGVAYFYMSRFGVRLTG